MMKKKKECMILLVLSIVCVFCAIIHQKNDISEMQEVSLSAAQEEGNTTDSDEKNSIPVTDSQEDDWQNH